LAENGNGGDDDTSIGEDGNNVISENDDCIEIEFDVM